MFKLMTLMCYCCFGFVQLLWFWTCLKEVSMFNTQKSICVAPERYPILSRTMVQIEHRFLDPRCFLARTWLHTLHKQNNTKNGKQQLQFVDSSRYWFQVCSGQRQCVGYIVAKRVGKGRQVAILFIKSADPKIRRFVKLGTATGDGC